VTGLLKAVAHPQNRCHDHLDRARVRAPLESEGGVDMSTPVLGSFRLPAISRL
jgi:hypothetical protein